MRRTLAGAPTNIARAWTASGARGSRRRRAGIPPRSRGEIFACWIEGGYFHPSAEGSPGRELLGRDPAAQRHRRAAHGPRAQRHHAGLADADAPDAGPQRALDARHRPRRDRDPGGGREGAAGAGDLAPRARPRGVRRARLGVERAVRLADRRAVQAPRRVVRLRAPSASPSTRATSRPSTRSSSRSTSAATSTATTTWSTGTRARARRSPTSRSRTARSTDTLYEIDYPVEDSDERDHGGHGAAGDDARRHGRRGEPERRALPRPGRQATRSCRWSAASCRSSPTTTSTPSSGPAR